MTNTRKGGKSVEESIDRLKKDLTDLREAMGLPGEDELKKMPEEVLRKMTDVAHDIVSTGSDFAEKTLRVLRMSAEGAVDGAKRGMGDEQEKPETKTKTTPTGS